jgi:2'-5' RNA ligase
VNGGDALVRAFVAVELPDAVRDALRKCVRKLERAGGRVRWTKPANLHLTLRFLGDVPVSQLDLLAMALDEVGARHAPFEAAVEDLGSFGSRNRPSVIWAGCMDPDGALAGLQSEIEAAVVSLGFVAESRPFHPHVTLGRHRPGRPAGSLTSALDSLRSARFGAFRVSDVILVRSQLSPQGPAYTTLHRARLKGD